MSQAELSVTSPGKLIRWHYLWYAAAALVVMVAVIASGHLWSLNFVHVFSGLLWTGIDLFMGFVLGPILRGSTFQHAKPCSCDLPRAHCS